MVFRKELLGACLVVALCCMAAPLTSQAAGLDARRQGVATSMFEEHAVLTEEIHRDFWDGLEDPKNPSTQASMDRLSAALKNAIELQRATAVSYKASIKQRKPVVDPSYDAALHSRLEMLRARNLSPENVLATDKAFRDSLPNVAKGKSIESHGTRILMNNYLVDKSLQLIEASHARLERLFNPVWTPPAAN
ncbi:MAG: hypothetical protein V4679_12735 [Pseudomonadota bacterium]